MQKTSAVVILLFLVFAGSVTAVPSSSDGGVRAALPPGFVRVLDVQDGNGVSRGSLLQAVDWLEDRRIARWLVVNPGGERLVISEEQLPLEGITRVRIEHEQSGWFAELTEESGVRLDRVDQLGNPLAVVDAFSEGERPRTVVLGARSLAEPFEHSSTTWDDGFLDQFFWLFESQPAADVFAAAVDGGAVDALRFLRSVAGCESCAFSAGSAGMLLDFVNRSLEEHGRLDGVEESAQTWRTEPTTAVRRATEDQRILEILATFQSVPDTDPLADLRP